MTGIEAEEHYLVAAIESVLAQLYPHWELCIADNVSTEPHIRRILDNYARQDARIRVAYREINGHVAVAYNTALEMAQGEVCLMFDSDDVLATHALLFVAGELVLRPDLEWIYCDSDLLDGAGRRFGPQFVGDANPDLFRSIDFMAVHACFSTRRMRELGGIRIGYEEAYNYDLGLRFLENIDLAQIRHIPHILYHARAIEGGLSNSYLLRPMNQDNGLRALQDHLDRLGIQARAEQRINNPGYRIRYAIPTPAPLVSIIIPTRDRLDLLRPCVASIMERTDYPAFEILIIDNSSSEPGTRAFLEYLVTRGVRIERFDAPFNWSAMNNFGVTQARGELLCFLNNDTEVINESWLTEMVSHAVRPDIGVVGAALWYPDNRLQHGGVIGMGMGPGHVFTLSDRGKWSNWRRATQNYLAVTGACFVVRKALYHQMGGFNAGHLAVAFNDVDFCFRVTETTGLRNLWTPFAELFHHETATRGPDDTEEKELKNRREVGYFYGIWLHWLENDPYVNPNLAWSHEVSLAEPPRVLARKTLHRYRIPPPPKLAVVHIPRAAGSVLRKRLSAEYPGPGTFIASGSEILGIYEQNPDVLARVSERARMAQVWFARFSYGVGRLLQHPCVYLTVLRDPVERVISHYRYITSASNSPLFGSILSELPLEDMVRKGVICSNLMTKKLLGGAPEEARMIDIMQSERAYGLPFVGFKFPPGIWAGRDDALLAAPDLPPDADFADLDRAFDVIAKEFGFVGLREALKLHTERLAETLGWDRSGPVPEIHVSGNSSTFEVTDGMRKTIEEYNQLDRRLYDSIAKKPGGFLLNETLLSSCARH
jgi:glycosyltransferase involved in cell wall biosynthesis